MRQLFLPNRAMARRTELLIVLGWIAIAFLIWVRSPFESLPTPLEVFSAFPSLWWEKGMGHELGTTLALIIEATALTALISLALAYVSVLAIVRPVVAAASKMRFLGITGLVFPFTLMTGGGHALKVWLLTFGMTGFFVTSMAQVVQDIPRERFDHMRVLGASEWRIVYEVVIRGTLDKALDILRQNLAIGWNMITMVEGISRAEGGIGALILNENKHFHLAELYAVLIVILVVGLLLDAAMGGLIRVLCPHAELEVVRR